MTYDAPGHNELMTKNISTCHVYVSESCLVNSLISTLYMLQIVYQDISTISMQDGIFYANLVSYAYTTELIPLIASGPFY